MPSPALRDLLDHERRDAQALLAAVQLAQSQTLAQAQATQESGLQALDAVLGLAQSGSLPELLTRRGLQEL